MSKAAAMKMKIEMLAPDKLTGYERNSRTHSPAQVKQIEASIREFGFTNPVLIGDDNVIIAGHGRVLAARSMGMDQVPCLRLSHLSEAQRRAYIIADNKLAENAGWDTDLLRLELGYLAEMNFDTELLGFGPDELEGIMGQDGFAGLTDENATPGVPADPVTREGDLWQLGRHKIICGSSTDAEVVSRLLSGLKPHLMVTDPPYGVEYDAGWREKLHSNRRTGGGVRNSERRGYERQYCRLA